MCSEVCAHWFELQSHLDERELYEWRPVVGQVRVFPPGCLQEGEIKYESTEPEGWGGGCGAGVGVRY